MRSLSHQLIQEWSRTKKKGGFWGLGGGVGQSSRVVTPCCSLLHTSQPCTKMSFTHQHWANVPSLVVWSGPQVEVENKTKTLWLEPTDLSPYPVSEGGLVLPRLQRNHSGPLPFGRRPRLLARSSWKPCLHTCPSSSDRLLTNSTLTSGEGLTDHRTLRCLLSSPQPGGWLLSSCSHAEGWRDVFNTTPSEQKSY